MKKFLIILCIAMTGCSILGISNGRIEKMSDKIRMYVCNLDPVAREVARNELAANGITVKVDCAFKKDVSQ